MSTGRWHAPIGAASGGRRTTRIVAVGAAKYNAGKSVVALNLAASMAALGRQVVLVDLDPSDLRVGFNNFYVLTRYNRSAFYAAAAYDLAQAIKQRLQEEGR